MSLQTCDTIALKNCISKYNFSITNNNQALNTNSLRFFWSSWLNYYSRVDEVRAAIDPTSSNVISSAYISSLLKSNNINDLDFFFICYLKTSELINLKVNERVFFVTFFFYFVLII